MSDTETPLDQGTFADADFSSKPEVQTDRQEESFGKRAEKRVLGALSRAKAAEELRDQTLREAAELRRELFELRKSNATQRHDLTSSSVAEAERELRAAVVDGDVDAQVAAQSKLASAQAMLQDTRRGKEQAEQTVLEPARVVTGPTAAMQDWLDDNREWFEHNGAMKDAAMSFHTTAVRMGLVPETPAYFAHIDGKMRAKYPDYFADDDGDAGVSRDEEHTPKPSPRSPVAGAAARRNAGPGGARPAGTIKATEAEVEAAKITGVTIQAYMASKAARAARK
jgi:hypothetical protein